MEALRAIDEIRADPTPDERRKHAVTTSSEVIFLMYYGDLVWMTYQVVDLEMISILTVVARHRQR